MEDSKTKAGGGSVASLFFVEVQRSRGSYRGIVQQVLLDAVADDIGFPKMSLRLARGIHPGS